MHTSSLTPDQALQTLLDGNRRFCTGKAVHPHQSAGRRSEVVAGQHPLAMVLCCSDSRVPPEVLFDQGVGDIFVVRNAGNIVDDVVLGSLEYGAEHLGANLILVLGHTRCGAVTAAVQGGEAHGHIHRIINTIMPAVAATRGEAGDAILNATRANVRRVVRDIQGCWPILAEMATKGQLKVAGGLYHLDSGEVELV